MGALPFTVYFDLETTCGKSLYENFTNPTKNMYTVFYCFVIVFNPLFHLNKVTVLRSFTDSVEELADVSYLKEEMLRHRDLVTQLLGCVQNAASKKKRFFINRDVLL